MLTVDEQTVWFAVEQTQLDMRLDNDFSMLRLLTSNEVRYEIKITEKNKNQIAADSNKQSEQQVSFQKQRLSRDNENDVKINSNTKVITRNNQSIETNEFEKREDSKCDFS